MILLVILAVLLYAAIGLFIDEWMAKDGTKRLGAPSALVWPIIIIGMIVLLFDEYVRRFARFVRNAFKED